LRVAATAFVVILQAARITGAAASGDGQAAAARAVKVAGNVENGKVMFLTHQCWACHGYTGETGTRLIQDNGTFVARLSSVDGFINYIRAPRPNDPPPARSVTIMPSYGVNSLSDQQAADLYAYIRTFKPTQPPLKDIPLLNQMLREGGKVKK
jgi:mono/diheme cytochrome c family protein